jgi:hypothetical protein
MKAARALPAGWSSHLLPDEGHVAPHANPHSSQSSVGGAASDAGCQSVLSPARDDVQHQKGHEGQRKHGHHDPALEATHGSPRSATWYQGIESLQQFRHRHSEGKGQLGHYSNGRIVVACLEFIHDVRSSGSHRQGDESIPVALGAGAPATTEIHGCGKRRGRIPRHRAILTGSKP